jgi:mono/diheme cytochrome c family protein
VEDRDRLERETSDWGILGWGILVGIAVVAVVAAAYVIGLNKGEADANRDLAATASAPPATTAPADTDATSEAAATTFAATCGGCHALAAAGTTGTAGPDLDSLRPAKEQVLAAIENGGLGTGQMPGGLLAGTEAEQVADYVAAFAGG